MTQTWNWAWLTVAFLAELAALAALAAWGWSAGGSMASRLLLAAGAPLLAGAVWGMFAAPRAVVTLPAVAVLVKILVFGAGALALLALDRPGWAVGLAAAAVLSSVLSTPPDGPAPEVAPAPPGVSAPASG